MTDLLVLELVEKRLVTDQIVLTIGYDVDNVKRQVIRERLLQTDTEEDSKACAWFC